MTLYELADLLALKINADLQEDMRDEPRSLVTDACLAVLIDLGVIDNAAVPTEKGEAYIRALQSVPLPVQRWVIPEVSRAAEEGVKPSNGVAEHQDGDRSGQAAEASRRHSAQRRRKKQQTEAEK